MELRSPTHAKRNKYGVDSSRRVRPQSPDSHYESYRPRSPQDGFMHDRGRGPATPPPMIPHQNQRRYNNSGSQRSGYSHRSRALSPPTSPAPVRKRRVSISPPARYKKEFFNDSADVASSSDDCESEPYEVEHRKSRMLKHGLGTRLWNQWEQHREMCCLSHNYFVKHLLTLHRKHCQWVNSLSQEQSSDDSTPPMHAHKRRKKKKKHRHARVMMSPDHSGGSLSPPPYSHRSRMVEDPRMDHKSHMYHSGGMHPHMGSVSPPMMGGHMRRHHPSMSPSPPAHFDFPPHGHPHPPVDRYPMHPMGGGGRMRSHGMLIGSGGSSNFTGGGGHQPHPAVGGIVMNRPISPSMSHTSRHSGTRQSSQRQAPPRRASSSNESGQVSETSSVGGGSVDATLPSDGPKLNTNGEKIGVCVRNLPLRSSDTSLRDGLFHEFKKFGKVTSVNIFDIGQNRYAVVSFRKAEQAKEALDDSHDRVFFGSKIKVEEHVGFECDDVPAEEEAELDEYHLKATRTLFVGNLEKDISTQILTDLFSPYGEILDIDIKCPYQGAATAYAFIQYPDIKSVVKAQKGFTGEIIGKKVKLGFGKSMPSGTVWIDCLPEEVTLDVVGNMFSRYGMVHFIFIDKPKGQALIFYEDLEPSRRACNDVRGRIVGTSKLQVDFASRECEDHFFDRLETSGQLMPGDRPSVEARNALQKSAIQARQQNFQGQMQGPNMRGGHHRGFMGPNNYGGPPGGPPMRF